MSLVVLPLVWMAGVANPADDPGVAHASDWVLSDPSAAAFGTGVGVAGDLVLVNSRRDSGDIVLPFSLSGDTWVAQAPITSTLAEGFFGAHMAWSDPYLYVGDPPDNSGDTGGIVVFERVGDTFVEQVRIPYTDGSGAAGFGRDFDLSGDTLAVGAPPNAIDVFVGSGTTWTLEQTVAPSGGQPGAFALDGDALVIAPVNAPVEVWRRDMAVWAQEQQLTVTANGVDVVGTRLVAAVPGDATELKTFDFDGNTWSLSDETAAPGAHDMFFGDDVLLSADEVVVSGSGSIVGGAVVVLFRWEAGAWQLRYQNTGGSDLARDGSTIVLGRPADADQEALVIEFAGTDIGVPCTDDIQCYTGECVSGVCCNAPCEGACEVCSVAEGGTADGMCSVRSDCCSMDSQCPASPDACNRSFCNTATNACETEYVCCSSDAECATGDPCMMGTCDATTMMCVYTPIECGTSASTTGPNTGSASDTFGSSGDDTSALEEPMLVGGCGCRAPGRNGLGGWVWWAFALLGLRRRRAQI